MTVVDAYKIAQKFTDKYEIDRTSCTELVDSWLFCLIEKNGFPAFQSPVRVFKNGDPPVQFNPLTNFNETTKICIQEVDLRGLL